MHNLQLREAADSDLETIVAVIRAAFAEYEGRLDPPSGGARDTVESLREKIADGNAVLALLDDQVIGCVFYRPDCDHLYFGRLAVLPAHRQRGVGRALIAYVEERARTLGLPRIRIGVRIGLPELFAAYERIGYRTIAEHSHEGYAQPTYVSMEKLL